MKSFIVTSFFLLRLPFPWVTAFQAHYAVEQFRRTGPLASQVIDDLKSEIQAQIVGTQRGLKTTDNQKEAIDRLIQDLEKSCELAAPARSPLMGGKWIVEYTTSPPPSNGKLGPFVGFARQIIDLDEGTYVNYLSVPGDVEKEWLSASLEATFEEWDGEFLEDDREEESKTINVAMDDNNDVTVKENNREEKADDFISAFKSMFSGNNKDNSVSDYGALNWKVDFQTLTIKAFGITLLTKKFENTSRVWKMSYLDESSRVGKELVYPAHLFLSCISNEILESILFILTLHMNTYLLHSSSWTYWKR